MTVRYITSGFADVVFALVVFRLVRLRIVPFSVPCCPFYFRFGLRCACLNRSWLCVKFTLSLVAVCRHVLRISLSRHCPCFSSRPQCRDVSIWLTLQVFAAMLCWVVLTPACPFPLPCHVVCHTYVSARAALDQSRVCDGLRRIQRCQFFVCQRLLRI